MTDFWDNAVFYSGNYEGNPMQSHLQIHQYMHLSQAHFDHWNILFEATIDALFEGKNTERLKNSARSISKVIQDKLFR
jgi:hemoglobin